MNFLVEFFYAAILGFFSQNLAFELGVGTGNLFKLSVDKTSRRRYFFIVMLITTLVATAVTYILDAYVISYTVTNYTMRECVRGLAFVVVIAAMEIGFELLLSWCAPTFRRTIGDNLPSACMNSGVLAILLLNRQFEYGFVESELFALMAVLGFIVSAFREILGYGTFFDVAVPFFENHCIPVLAGVPGGLLIMAILAWAVRAVGFKMGTVKEEEK